MSSRIKLNREQTKITCTSENESSNFKLPGSVNVKKVKQNKEIVCENKSDIQEGKNSRDEDCKHDNFGYGSPSDQEYLSANDSSHERSQDSSHERSRDSSHERSQVDSEVMQILDVKYDQDFSESKNYNKRKLIEHTSEKNDEIKKNKGAGWYVEDSTKNNEDNNNNSKYSGNSRLITSSQACLMIKHGLKGNLLYKMCGPNYNGLDKPVGVAQLPTGEVVVADTFNDRMVVFSSTGKFDKSFASPNMKRPSAVITLSNGNFIVKDHYSIDHFDSECNYIGPLYHSALLKHPFGLTVTDQGKLITMETGKEGVIHLVIMDIYGIEDIKRILVNLKISHRDAAFSKPRFITHQTDNMVLVVDLGLNCVFKIKYNVHLAQGEVCKKIGSKGNKNGQFIDPSGICIDQDQYILVGDSKNHRIQLFDPEGEFLSVLKLDVPLKRPSGMFLSQDGELLVINYWENNVAKYQLALE